MDNPLTLQERLQTSRLFDHDAMQSHALLNSKLQALKNGHNPPSIVPLLDHLYHVNAVTEAVSIMQDNELWQPSDYWDPEKVPGFSWRNKMEQVARINARDGITINVDTRTNATTRMPVSIMYTAVSNLVKNSRKMVRHGGTISIEISDYVGELTYHVELYDDVPTTNTFVRFAVTDTGPGFSQDRPLREYFNDGASAGSGGFGLYFVALVAKYLRVHIAVKSAPGECTVALYCPKPQANHPQGS